MRTAVTIRDLMLDPDLFGKQFGGDSWKAWRALLASFYGLPLGEEELALFQRITSLPGPVQAMLLELWLTVAVEGGELQIAALMAVNEAEYKDYTPPAPGEVSGDLVVITDEIAFWRSDYSANHDGEIINALCPTMATS